MFNSTTLLRFLLASFICVSCVSAVISSRHATHHTRVVGRGLTVESYHPKRTYETFGKGIEHSAASGLAKGDNLKSSAESFVSSHLNLDSAKVAYHSGFTAETARYAYMKQFHNDIPFANAVANVAFKDDRVVAFGSSFVATSQIADSTPSIDVTTAIKNAEQALNGKYNEFPTSVQYFAKSDGSVALTHVIQIQNEEASTWYQAFIDAHDGSLVSIVDFVADAAYRVLPTTRIDPTQGFELLTDPQDPVASPFGWHSTGTTNTTTTAGNNVIAYNGTQASVSNESASGLVFNYTQDPTLDPTASQNLNAARVNAFYLMNTVHDVSYRYGFTEAAFNFQDNNNGKGGVGGDRVWVSVQDGNGTNNARFTTPPEGQSGLCQMFIFTVTDPRRDGVLENDIPLHEATHGITNRMTGGGTATCLTTLEAGGMGEGWSDAMADWFQAKANFADFTSGQYVLNNTAGVRSHPYSVSTDVNPYTYATVPTATEVHEVGEVWAEILHVILATFIDALGFSATAKTNPDGTEGNIVWLHLFIDALPLQPCEPTFITGRDAWLQADVNRYDGANKCLIWKGFATRGLGVNAADYVDDFTVPEECEQSMDNAKL